MKTIGMALVEEEPFKGSWNEEKFTKAERTAICFRVGYWKWVVGPELENDNTQDLFNNMRDFSEGGNISSLMITQGASIKERNWSMLYDVHINGGYDGSTLDKEVAAQVELMWSH